MQPDHTGAQLFAVFLLLDTFWSGLLSLLIFSHYSKYKTASLAIGAIQNVKASPRKKAQKAEGNKKSEAPPEVLLLEHVQVSPANVSGLLGAGSTALESPRLTP